MFPIIDTHQHLWDINLLHLPWLDREPSLNRSHLMDEYRREADGLNIARTIYMEVDVDANHRQAEADAILELCADPRNSMAGVVLRGNPLDADFHDYIRDYAQNPYVKGIRQVLHGELPAGYCLQPEFVRGIQLLGELNLRFDLCLRSTDLKDGAKLAESCPDTTFILDHCGNADPKSADLSQWKQDIGWIADRPNVVCKVSGIVAAAHPDWTPQDLAPIIDHTIAAFGPERVMFASDWPVCTLRATLRQWVRALKEIVSSRPEPQVRLLFHDTAVRVYDLNVQ